MTDRTHPADPAEDEPGRLTDLLTRPTPSTALQARVTASLLALGLVRGPPARRPWRAPALAAIAAGLICLSAGAGLQWRRDHPGTLAPAREPEFALLLYQNGSAEAGPGDVEAHRRWARELAEQGHRVSGEKLADGGTVLAGSAAGPDSSRTELSLRGVFVISARDEAEAIRIARSLPHLTHGGRVVVRRVDPT